MAKQNYILTYDIGSTAVKLILFDTNLNVIYKDEKKVKTYKEDSFDYQKATDWWNIIVELTNEMVKDNNIKSEKIIAISSTGQMEDCLLLDDRGEALTEVLLYSDGRGKEEYQYLVDKYGKEKLDRITGNNFDTLMSINKYMWLRDKRPQIFEEHKHLILGSKDYINFRLTGRNVTDYTNASTTGFLDINRMKINKEIISYLDFDNEKLPKIKKATDIIGRLKESPAEKLGLEAGIPIINGAGDVGASTLGAGAWNEGDIYCYLGTTGWLAMPSEDISENKNLFTLSNVKGDGYIIAGAVLNAGQTYDWFLSKIMGYDNLNSDKYSNIENILKNINKKEIGVTFVPYLNGERSPLKVETDNGIFAAMGTDTDKFKMLYSVLEGVSFSLKHNMLEMMGNIELEDEKGKSINIIGGGSKSQIWPQLIATILERKVNVLELEAGAPSLGSALIALKALNHEKQLTIDNIYKNTETFSPLEEEVSHYRKKYKKYLELLKDNFYN